MVVSRVRRQVSSIKLRVEIRESPASALSSINSASRSTILAYNAAIISRYQSGELNTAWSTVFGSSIPSPDSMSCQEPGNYTTVQLNIISRLVLEIPPATCPMLSPCETQPVLKAYDSTGNVIQKLGSDDQPWQIAATILGSSGATVSGGIANYVNGQSQFTTFGISATGSYQIQFSFLTPYGVVK